MLQFLKKAFHYISKSYLIFFMKSNLFSSKHLQIFKLKWPLLKKKKFMWFNVDFLVVSPNLRLNNW